MYGITVKNLRNTICGDFQKSYPKLTQANFLGNFCHWGRQTMQLGLYSLSDKTAYHQNAWSFKP